jgi:GT2 family glycosyltransferase
MMDMVRAGETECGTRLPSVAVTIVTYNSAKFIARCLESVFEQDYPNLQVVIVDNASVDDSAAQAARFLPRVNLIRSQMNTGFAGGQNLAIASCRSDWVLTLNPDVRMERNFISSLVNAAARTDQRIGTVCGKLLSMGEDFAVPQNTTFDSTGIFMTPNLRHFDRGSKLPDEGAFDRDEYVFGATGAAALYKREMIDDISLNREFFDEDFFAYREDADVAWRAQLLGWTCLYTPSAVAYHVRSVLPSNRNRVSPFINRHSVKNRFLLRIKNATSGLYKRFWFPMTTRDLLVIAGCFLREWSSLPALAEVVRLLPKTLAKRRSIMAKKRVPDAYINQWFSFEPVGLPAASRQNKEVAAS